VTETDGTPGKVIYLGACLIAAVRLPPEEKWDNLRERPTRRMAQPNAFPLRLCGLLPLEGKEDTFKGKEEPIMNVPLKKRRDFNPAAFLANAGLGRKIVHLGNKEEAFFQGDPADSVFYIQSGRIKLSVIAKTGKEAIVGLLGAGSFCGEECVASSQLVRAVSACAITPRVLLKIDRKEMIRALHQEQALSDVFVAYLLERNARVREDLVDQLFNSSEKRLARVLLLLAQFGKDGAPETVIPKISQEVLA
jgi:CRP/FNR family cyclic AMP-dependent transcriptional regulator